MSSVLKKIASVLSSDKGALSVEYGLILSGVSALGIYVVAALTGTSSSVFSSMKELFTDINDSLVLTTPT